MDVLLPFFAHLNSTVILTKLMVLKLEAGSTTLEKKLFTLREQQLGWSSIQELRGTWQDNYVGDEKMGWLGGPMFQQRRDSAGELSWPQLWEFLLWQKVDPGLERRLIPPVRAGQCNKVQLKVLLNPGTHSKAVLNPTITNMIIIVRALALIITTCKHPPWVRPASKSLQLSSAPKA